VLGREEICKTQKDGDGAAFDFRRRRRAMASADFTWSETLAPADPAISLDILRVVAIGGQPFGRYKAIVRGQRVRAGSVAIACDICILMNLRYRCVEGVDAARGATHAGQGGRVS
jgi:hypothetical protein